MQFCSGAYACSYVIVCCQVLGQDTLQPANLEAKLASMAEGATVTGLH